MKKRAYIDPKTYAKIDSLYAKKQAGLERIINNYIALRREALKSLRDAFTAEDKVGLLAAFNGTILDVTIGIPAKAILIAQIEDSETYDNASQFHGYNYEKLLLRLEALDELRATFLLEEIHIFWNEQEDPKIEDFLK